MARYYMAGVSRQKHQEYLDLTKSSFGAACECNKTKFIEVNKLDNYMQCPSCKKIYNYSIPINI